MMSDATILTLAGIVVTAGPLWLAAWRQGARTTEIIDKVSAVDVKTDHIVTLTNSNLSAVKEELQTANGHIKALQDVVKSLADRNGRVDAHAKREPEPENKATDKVVNPTGKPVKITSETVTTTKIVPKGLT